MCMDKQVQYNVLRSEFEIFFLSVCLRSAMCVKLDHLIIAQYITSMRRNPRTQLSIQVEAEDTIVK